MTEHMGTGSQRVPKDPLGTRTGTPPAAVVFDLDGTVALTLHLQFAVWKEVFETFLGRRSPWFRSFDWADYRAYVDGRARADGVRVFLASRGVVLPEGTPADPPDVDTIRGLANCKTRLFRARLAHATVAPDHGAIPLVRGLRAAGARVGLASASEDTHEIVERAGLGGDVFDVMMDEATSDERRLRGKPRPDVLLTCLELLGQPDPRRAVVVDDSIVGVQAGRAAAFGLVVGVDRGGNATALRLHGAEWIVSGLAELSGDALRVPSRARGF